MRFPGRQHLANTSSSERKDRTECWRRPGGLASAALHTLILLSFHLQLSATCSRRARRSHRCLSQKKNSLYVFLQHGLKLPLKSWFSFCSAPTINDVFSSFLTDFSPTSSLHILQCSHRVCYTVFLLITNLHQGLPI